MGSLWNGNRAVPWFAYTQSIVVVDIDGVDEGNVWMHDLHGEAGIEDNWDDDFFGNPVDAFFKRR